MFMTTSGFLILVGLFSLALWVFAELGGLPGKMAAARNHPQAEAINVLGWFGLLFGGVGWMVALVWAHMKPVFAPIAQAPAGSEGGAPDGAPGEDS